MLDYVLKAPEFRCGNCGWTLFTFPNYTYPIDSFRVKCLNNHCTQFEHVYKIRLEKVAAIYQGVDEASIVQYDDHMKAAKQIIMGAINSAL